jgi:hypothetical protein
MEDGNLCCITKFEKENPSYESSTLIKGEGLNSGAIGNILGNTIENIKLHKTPLQGNHLKLQKKHFI